MWFFCPNLFAPFKMFFESTHYENECFKISVSSNREIRSFKKSLLWIESRQGRATLLWLQNPFGRAIFISSCKKIAPTQKLLIEGIKRSFLYCQIINSDCYNVTSILRMQENGLLGKWVATFNPEAKECLSKNNFKKTEKPRISLKNLTSAFILLIFGICVSLIVFFLELICCLNSSR